MLVATIAALAAAALFAVAAALQHRSAGLVTEADQRATAGLTGFMSGTLRHPLWIIGTVADIGGLVLHAVALRYGPLTLVQPLLVTGVIFALPLRQFVEGRPALRNELGWATALAIGLVLFLTIATPANDVAYSPDVAPTVVMGLVIGGGVLVCFVAGRRAGGNAAAALLGCAAALAFAAAAGLLKETMDLFRSGGIAALATAWPVYALMAVGAIGLFLNQLAYQAGPLRSSLPAIITIDPIVSLIIGVTIFDEQFRNSPIAIVAEVIGLALVVVAALGLARSDPGPAPAATPAPTKDTRSPVNAPTPSNIP